MSGKFYRVQCPECENEQIVFSKPATPIHCTDCGELLATPTGGKGRLTADVIETVEAR